MADCHDLFLQYHEKIILQDSKSQNLKSARDGIRGRIENHFRKNLEQAIPNFRMQGSFAMKTTVNPIDGEYDVDDGIYLNNLEEDKEKWPTPATVHNWIFDAINGHTNEKPIDKRTCVRAIYAGNYHVDLPIYGTYNDERYLAEKSDIGWHVSEPCKLTDWFIAKVQKQSEQLREVVRYVKAWADYDSKKNGELPTSIILTILSSNNFHAIDNRNDSSFARTMDNIRNALAYSFNVYNPIDGTEDLAKRLSDSCKENFRNRLKSAVQVASNALMSDSKKDACKEWRKLLGERFPDCETISESGKSLRTAAPAIIHDDARSA
jgi:hypothetical protein